MSLNTLIPCLSDGINAALSELNAAALNSITEIRLRKNLPLVLCVGKNVYFITPKGKLLNHCSEYAYRVDEEEFDVVFRRLCNYSVHCEIDNLVNGYITVKGGNRVGVCSTAVRTNGTVTAVKEITSLNIRIAKEIRDCAKPILNLLYVNDFPSIIVASPPSGGKTTFLRDFTRLISGGFNNKYIKTAVIDERNEIACKDDGNITADLGVNTDVITGFSKAAGIEIAVRTLAPQMIICDEISSLKEIEAMKNGFLSGAAFAVSVHAKSKEQLMNKHIVRNLIATREFSYIVLLKDYTNEFEIMEVS